MSRWGGCPRIVESRLVWTGYNELTMKEDGPIHEVLQMRRTAWALVMGVALGVCARDAHSVVMRDGMTDAVPRP